MTSERIAKDLRSDLMTGRLRPGAELQQVELAARFGVSRIPVRDALRLLVAEGLVTIEPGRGARVVALTRDDVAELYHLRLLLESDCLARAAARATAADLDRIDRYRRKAELDAATPDWDDGDWAFHAALYALAGRPRQMDLIRTLRQTCRMLGAAYEKLPDARDRWCADHAGIVEHLRHADADAAVSALRRHIEGARDHLLDVMAERGDR